MLALRTVTYCTAKRGDPKIRVGARWRGEPVPRPMTTVRGALISRTSASMVLGSGAPGTKRQSAPASRYALHRSTASAKTLLRTSQVDIGSGRENKRNSRRVRGASCCPNARDSVLSVEQGLRRIAAVVLDVRAHHTSTNRSRDGFSNLFRARTVARLEIGGDRKWTCRSNGHPRDPAWSPCSQQLLDQGIPARKPRLHS